MPRAENQVDGGSVARGSRHASLSCSRSDASWFSCVALVVAARVLSLAVTPSAERAVSLAAGPLLKA